MCVCVCVHMINYFCLSSQQISKGNAEELKKNVEKHIRHEVAQLVEALFYKLEVHGFAA